MLSEEVMIVVLLGSSMQNHDAVGRALARAMGARFVDASLLRGAPSPPPQAEGWLHALGRTLASTGKGRHMVVCCDSLQPSERAVLKTYCPSLRLVELRGTPEGVAAAPAEAQVDTVTVVVDRSDPVEVVAARLYGLFVLELDDLASAPMSS